MVSSAGLHSQKIGNVIRTIDIWYGDAASRPLAVEAYGAVTNLGTAYRKLKDKLDFYSLFDRFGMGETIDATQRHPEAPREMFAAGQAV